MGSEGVHRVARPGRVGKTLHWCREYGSGHAASEGGDGSEGTSRSIVLVTVALIRGRTLREGSLSGAGRGSFFRSRERDPFGFGRVHGSARGRP